MFVSQRASFYLRSATRKKRKEIMSERTFILVIHVSVEVSMTRVVEIRIVALVKFNKLLHINENSLFRPFWYLGPILKD